MREVRARLACDARAGVAAAFNAGCAMSQGTWPDETIGAVLRTRSAAVRVAAGIRQAFVGNTTCSM